MSYNRKIKLFAELLKESQKTFVLTGAGISTESGLPDYRGPGGLWQRMDPQKVDTIQALRNDPARFYMESLERWYDWREVEPGFSHRALAYLEEKGYLSGIITQNMDSLHKKAASVELWEIHGHTRTCRCMDCGEKYEFTVLLEQLKQGSLPPLCKKCSGTLRPDVVLRGEQLGEDFVHACRAMEKCDLLVAIGTGLAVYPAAKLPEYARKIIIVNKTPTGWDDKANLVINENAGKVFEDLILELGEIFSWGEDE